MIKDDKSQILEKTLASKAATVAVGCNQGKHRSCLVLSSCH